jgi:hypothetical protein
MIMLDPIHTGSLFGFHGRDQSAHCLLMLAASMCMSNLRTYNLHEALDCTCQSVDHMFSSHLDLINCLTLIVRVSIHHHIHTFTT